MTKLLRSLRNAVPVIVVLAVLLAAMYPVALLFGLPLAQQRMENLNNWVRATVSASAVNDLSVTVRLAFGGGDPAGLGRASASPENAVLIMGEEPLDVVFDLEGDVANLAEPLDQPLVAWGEELSPAEAGAAAAAESSAVAAAESGAAAAPEPNAVAQSPDTAARVFTLPDGLTEAGRLPAALYRGDALLRRGSVAAVERADGVRVRFTVPGASQLTAAEESEGPGAAGTGASTRPPAVALVAAAVLLEGTGFEQDGNELVFAAAPAFNAPIRLITADYEYADEAAGVVVLAEPSQAAPRAALEVVALAEGLVGEVDGDNRVFTLQHAPLVETDATRRIFLDDRELSGIAERPEERVDGQRDTFTFAGDQGIVTVEGAAQDVGVDFERAGNEVVFTNPPARNAALRQYRDYLLSDPASGTVTLAVAPNVGERLWAYSYSYYDRPNCGTSIFECFLSLPQHPVPFPHWIAERLVPFFTAYPLSDSRNVVRAVLYTATGTMIALLVGAVLGVLLAVLFVRVRPFEQALLPWVIASQTIPVIALVPVLLLLLGNAGVTVQTSLVPAAIIGAYIAFFPVTVGTVTGLRAVDPLALDLMKGYAASPLQVFLKVRFPAAVPFFFTSLKLGAAAALVGALVAEVESNNRLGLGYAIIGQVQAGDVADVWILLGISALLGIGLVGLVGLVQRLAAPWERPSSVGIGDGEAAS